MQLLVFPQRRIANSIKVIGEPEQIVINGKRFYRVTLQDIETETLFYRHLRSVTTICKGAVIPGFFEEWKMQQVEQLGIAGCKAALEQAAHDGTLLHKFIEDHINGHEVNRRSLAEVDGQKFAFDEDIWPKYEGYLRWEEKRKPTWKWTEKTLYSLQHGYAGRSDGKAEIASLGIIPIIDFKSSKAVRQDHLQQVSSYLFAENEMDGDADSGLILALGAENKQGYSETFLKSPYKIHQHFMTFYHKNNLINHDSPILV